MLDVHNNMLILPFTNPSGWTKSDVMTEHYIHEYGSIFMTFSSSHGRHSPTAYPMDVLLGGLTIFVFTLMIFGEAFWMVIDSNLKKTLVKF